MKLYATTTSERASKGQGGQNFIDLQVRNKDKATILCLTITMENGEPQIKSIGGSSYLLERIKDMLSNQEQETSSADDKGKCVCTAACGAGLGHNLVKGVCKVCNVKVQHNVDIHEHYIRKGEKQKGEMSEARQNYHCKICKDFDEWNNCQVCGRHK